MQTAQVKKTLKPEEHQDSLRKSLKIVVAVNLGPVHHCNFSKHLKAPKKKKTTSKALTAFTIQNWCLADFENFILKAKLKTLPNIIHWGFSFFFRRCLFAHTTSRQTHISAYVVNLWNSLDTTLNETTNSHIRKMFTDRILDQFKQRNELGHTHKAGDQEGLGRGQKYRNTQFWKICCFYY